MRSLIVRKIATNTAILVSGLVTMAVGAGAIIYGVVVNINNQLITGLETAFEIDTGLVNQGMTMIIAGSIVAVIGLVAVVIGATMKNTKARSIASNIVIYIVLGVLAVLWLTPIVYLLITSFRGEAGAHLDGYVIPREWTFGNFTKLFTDTSLFNFPRWFLNTFVVAIFSCVISTFFILFTSYAFSRLRFKMRRRMMNIVLVLGMFPGFMSIIAIYHLIGLVGLDQSLAALVLVYSGGAGLTYYIMKGFFDTIPKELDESAKFDGCTKWGVFVRITLPMSRPVITYTVLTTFIAPWVDFIVASVIMKDNYNNYTIALGLFRMLERENVYQWWTAFCAGAVLVSIPIAILFLIMQKNYV